jgi:hypothetical protein
MPIAQQCPSTRAAATMEVSSRFFSCHIHIVSRKRDDKVEKEKMLHGDKEKTCNLSLGRLGKRNKKYKRHEGISKRLTGGFPGQSECGDE